MTEHRISRRALAALSFFLLLALGFHSPLQAARRHNYVSLENAHLAVWRVGGYIGPSQYSSGTAFALRSNLFVTNSHVFHTLHRKGVTLPEVQLTQEKNSLKLQIDRILRLTDVYDLIFFRTRERVSPYMELAESSFGQLKELTLVGYPGGALRRIHQITKEVIYKDALDYGFQVATDHHGEFGGSSGGPILNARGQVVGIMVEATKRSNMSMGVRVERLYELLNKEKGAVCQVYDTFSDCMQLGAIDLVEAAGEKEPPPHRASYRTLAQYQLWFSAEKRGEDPSRYIDGLKEAAQMYPPAQYSLAWLYSKGKGGVSYDYKEFLILLKKAARARLPKAEYVMWTHYKNRNDAALAQKWWDRVSEQGFIRTDVGR